MTYYLSRFVVLAVFLSIPLLLVALYRESNAAALLTGALVVLAAIGCVLLMLVNLSC